LIKLTPFIPPHGGYRDLKFHQMAEIVYDTTTVFCDQKGQFSSFHQREGVAPRALLADGETQAPVIAKLSRTHDQMVQAARSGKQTIAEGSMASGTSKKTELKLIGVARASLEELLLDFQDFLRQRKLPLWPKGHPQAQEVRALAWKENRSYSTYKIYERHYNAL